MILEYDLNARHYARHFNNDDVTNHGIAKLLRSVADYVEHARGEYLSALSYENDGETCAAVTLVMSH